MKTAPIKLAFCLAATAAQADFIDTKWTVTSFAGEAWFVDAPGLIGATQEFYKGFAAGAFYACDYAGQSMTYTTYSTADFLANPEFATFAVVADQVKAAGATVYVHRISCAGGDAATRRVIYPFVTTEGRKTAFYLFEGGVFTLQAP
jgi:hypothetical protein